MQTRDVEAAISSTASASTPIASASTKKNEKTTVLTDEIGELHDDMAFCEERHGC